MIWAIFINIYLMKHNFFVSNVKIPEPVKWSSHVAKRK
jgi:hypothetical protein